MAQLTAYDALNQVKQQWLPFRHAVEEYSIPVASLYAQVRSGHIRSATWGRTRLLLRADIEAYLDERRRRRRQQAAVAGAGT